MLTSSENMNFKDFIDKAHDVWSIPLLAGTVESAANCIKYLSNLKPGDIIELENEKKGIVIDNRWRAGYISTLMEHNINIRGVSKHKVLVYAEVRIDAVFEPLLRKDKDSIEIPTHLVFSEILSILKERFNNKEI